MTQNELMHYGKKGMRWGTRHASTAKTVSDHARPGVDAVKNSSMAVTKTRGANKARSEVPKMTNAELKQKIQRMNLEQQYQNLNANQISKGRANVDTALTVAGGVLTAASSALDIALAVKQLKG
jgi:hypothetical protein